MRYLPLTNEDRSQMLASIGAKSIDDLFVDVPASARREGVVDLPTFMGELEVERELSRLAARNTPAGSAAFFCGAGAYRHHVPATVDHALAPLPRPSTPIPKAPAGSPRSACPTPPRSTP